MRLNKVSGRRFGGRLQSQHAAGARAFKVWVCRGCGLQHRPQPSQCIKCGRLDFDRFDSLSEANRWAQLLLYEKLGKITELRRQVRYPLLAQSPEGHPVEVGVYVADYVYRRDGKEVREDRKPSAGIDDLARLKLKIMEAMGRPVTLTSS